VVATPHFAKTTADGKARVEGVPGGAYEARVWHPRLRGATEATAQPITVMEDGEGRLAFTLSLKPEPRPAPRRERYEGQQQSG
jgi:hypothetical protein